MRKYSSAAEVVCLVLFLGVVHSAPLNEAPQVASKPSVDENPFFYSVDMNNFIEPSSVQPFSIPIVSLPPQANVTMSASAANITATMTNASVTTMTNSMYSELVGGTEDRFTFVVPTHTLDMCKFRLASQKLIQHSNGLVGEVVVMWIDYREVHPQMNEVRDQFRNAGIPFRLLAWNDVIREPKLPGWIAQQVAKLRVADHISTNHYIVLDSKNVVTRPLTRDSFQSSKMYNFMFSNLDNMSQPHKSWYIRTHETLRKPWVGSETAGESVTPFIMHTKAVRAMINAVESETGKSLESNIESKTGTEFCFYNVFIRREGLLDALHDKKPSHGFSRIVWGYENPMEHMQWQEHDPFLFFGVHHTWLSKVAPEKRPELIEMAKKLLGVTPDMWWFEVDQCFRSV
jgi:hypothetical protein